MPETSTSAEPAGLGDQLARWTAAGIIDHAQATRIASLESARPPDVAGQPRRSLPLIAEVLGYLGAVVALSAGFLLVRRLWPHLPPAASLSFTAVAATGLVLAGAALRVKSEPAFARLRSVLWLLATSAVAGFFAVLASSVVRLSDVHTGLVVEGAWTITALALWWFSRSWLQHLSAFFGVTALAATGLVEFHPHITLTWLGCAIWLVSAAWGAAAYRGYLAPAACGLLASGVGVLVGAILAMRPPAGEALAVLTVAGLLAAGVVTRKVLLIAIGAVGTLWVVPDTADRYLPGSVAAPLAVAVVGLVLLVIALWLARARKTAS